MGRRGCRTEGRGGWGACFGRCAAVAIHSALPDGRSWRPCRPGERTAANVEDSWAGYGPGREAGPVYSATATATATADGSEWHGSRQDRPGRAALEKGRKARMAIDFVHTGELVDAVISVLKGSGSGHIGGLPPAWFTRGASEYLETLDHGDLSDIAVTADALSRMLPAILVRGLGPQGAVEHISGVTKTRERLRVIHARRYDQCFAGDGIREPNMTRARERYAKIIGEALFNDPQGKLAVIDGESARTEVSLTCTDDNGAQVVQAVWRGWDLGYDIGNPSSTEDVRLIRRLPAQIWAIACDIDVMVRSG